MPNRKAKRLMRNKFLWVWNMARQDGFKETVFWPGSVPTREEITITMLIALLFERHSNAEHLSARAAWNVAVGLIPKVQRIMDVGPVKGYGQERKEGRQFKP